MDVPGDPHDKEATQAGIEDQLGRNTRITTAKDRRVGLLTMRQPCKDLLLRGRRPGRAVPETFITVDQTLESVVR